MIKQALQFMWACVSWLLPVLYVLLGMMALFTLLCLAWMAYFRYIKKMELPAFGQVRQKRPGLLRQLFYDVPRRYVMDRFEREPGFFGVQGIHMFTGEQGSGKTIAAVEMMLRLQKQYPAAKLITNFDVSTQDDALVHWSQLLTYTNGHQGVIVGIDEIQNWFMSGKNQLPVEMLEVATQNRKNRRILCCTAQVFTRVNKGLREQVNLIYQPHTFLGCFTVVLIRKPKFDSEGNVIELKHKGMYCFTHTPELRAAYDTYKVIHTLAKEGFKEPPAQQITNVYVAADSKRK
ncbi:MAG: hypothetical protein IJZ39_02645 [Oscillospiraceae bacterium]|nr:hypothetical protein [Oscillospiraceae bacterium]